jgi:hypothetical protein
MKLRRMAAWIAMVSGAVLLASTTGGIAASQGGKVENRWQQAGTHVARYRVYCSSGSESHQQVSITTQNGLMMHGLWDGKKFKEGRTYYARVEAVRADGTVTAKSRRIAFTITPVHSHAYPPKVSLNFQFKVLWANIAAHLGRHAI